MYHVNKIKTEPKSDKTEVTPVTIYFHEKSDQSKYNKQKMLEFSSKVSIITVSEK